MNPVANLFVSVADRLFRVLPLRISEMSKRTGTPSLTIVIKLGTSSIVHEKTHQPLISLLASIVETVERLRTNGHRVVLVSSGAIGVGLQRMNMAERPKSLAGKQALAAVGQGRLIALWDNLFGQLGQPIAQVLLTRGDISDRTRYLNAVNTFTELLSMGVVPIVNENDTVSVSEIRFGDNDTLSAVTASMLHADYLFLLTDVEALYTSNPRKDPLARPIEVVTSVSDIRKEVSTATLGSKLGTGGMETKLIAAEIATAAGVSVVITSSKRPEVIFDIIQYNSRSNISIDLGLGSPTPTPAPLTESTASPSPRPAAELLSRGRNLVSSTPAATGTNTPVRPLHTLFKSSATPLRDLKSWTSHTLSPAGGVVIDAGAHNVLSKRNSGGRLLPVGVLGTVGSFASGQAVRILTRRPRLIPSGALSVAHPKSGEGVARLADERDSPRSAPGIADLGVPGGVLLSRQLESLEIGVLPGSTGVIVTEAVVASVVEDLAENDASSAPLGDPTTELDELDVEWENVEVGRGLANYNSADITKVKGKKSSQIGQILGYADSEYVVENITIRISP